MSNKWSESITKIQGTIKNRENYRKILAVFLFGILPFFSFFMFETIAGNFKTIMENTKGIIFLNVLLWYLLYFLGFMLTNHVKYTIWILNTVTYVYGVINAFVVEFRSQPIMIMDFKSLSTAASVAGNYTYTFSSEMKWLGLIMLLINVSIGIWKIDFSLKKWRMRLVYSAISVGLTIVSLNGMIAGDWLAEAGFKYMDFFRFNHTYQTSGYMLCTMKTIEYLDIDEPEGYSVEEVKELADQTKTVQVDSKEESELPENIIVIMNESFSDISLLGDFNVEQPVLSNYYGLTENVVRGNMYVSAYGSATANTEFEFLTGNSVAYLPVGTIAYQMYVDEGDSSIVSVLKKNGYRSIAFHPFYKDNYNRSKVYQWYGFDEYYGIDEYYELDNVEDEIIRGFISDKSDYDALIEMYKNKNAGEKLFVFNVTIQNHGGYDIAEFEDSITLTDRPGEFPQVEQYLGLMKKTDDALQYLIDYFSNVNEKTVILLFGDHQPALESSFYDYIKEIKNYSDDMSFMMSVYTTQYMLWANYEINAKEVEYTSSNFLGTYLLDTIGIELPAYNQYLLNLQEQVPAMNFMGYIDKESIMHKNGEDTEEEEWLKEYQCFQYNNIHDEKHRIKELYE